MLKVIIEHTNITQKIFSIVWARSEQTLSSGGRLRCHRALARQVKNWRKLLDSLEIIMFYVEGQMPITCKFYG